VVAALTSRTPAGAELARHYARDSGIDVGHAAELVERAGGRAWARAEATRRTASAMRALDAVSPAMPGAADLHTLASLITERNS
jgi:geranylgeranyl diphosphate synthase type I